MEVKASDLRIGNYVAYPKWDRHEDEDRIFSVKAIAKDDMQLCLTDGRISTRVELRIVKPIPLSEEILLKCGFDNSLNSSYWSLKWLEVSTDGCGTYYYDLFRGQVAKIKYLHQLQNLYHSLTGQELNIEL